MNTDVYAVWFWFDDAHVVMVNKYEPVWISTTRATNNIQ